MNSPPSNSDAPGFELLDERIKRWIWEKGWTGLRDAQERAIRPILESKRDVIIAAATAAGKTEAAFLPILTLLASRGEESGLAVYISPLKALINDQWGRLDQLCESLDLPVIPWHGDVAASRKQRFLKYPRGILLITPESTEALFVRRGSQTIRLFAEVSHIVVDELHAFIGSERGKQMQSLLCRIEGAAGRRIPRIGLSATLGDMQSAAEYLRPGGGPAVEMIVSKATGQELLVQVRGYVVPTSTAGSATDEVAGAELVAQDAVADHLYKSLHGSNNLVFPNSRKNVELYTDALRRRCAHESVPVEFWPHHGSLSRDIREETERALKDGSRPATAVCTNTLELGIDIGAVKSVAQIGPGPSVASLRQRLGRSGRRPGEPAVLRSYAIEAQLTSKSTYSDRLRESLVQSVAMIQLLLRGWFEPPNAAGLHLSTLVQQVLSVIAERGGADALHLFHALVRDGAFRGVQASALTNLLRHLAMHDLIVQDPTGLLLLGQKGERLVASYDFYAAFTSEDEWQIACDGRVIGTLPISSPVMLGMRLIYAGRRWVVVSIDAEAQIISVRSDPGGKPPIFDSTRPNTHEIVRSEMRSILQTEGSIRFLDSTAKRLLEEAREQFRLLRLGQRQLIEDGTSIYLFTWAGDVANDTLVLLLKGLGLSQIDNEGLSVIIGKSDVSRVMDALSDVAELEDADLEGLLKDVFNMQRAKWDWALPDDLLRESFASSHLSFAQAREVAKTLIDTPVA